MAKRTKNPSKDPMAHTLAEESSQAKDSEKTVSREQKPMDSVALFGKTVETQQRQEFHSPPTHIDEVPTLADGNISLQKLLQGDELGPSSHPKEDESLRIFSGHFEQSHAPHTLDAEPLEKSVPFDPSQTMQSPKADGVLKAQANSTRRKLATNRFRYQDGQLESYDEEQTDAQSIPTQATLEQFAETAYSLDNAPFIEEVGDAFHSSNVSSAVPSPGGLEPKVQSVIEPSMDLSSGFATTFDGGPGGVSVQAKILSASASLGEMRLSRSSEQASRRSKIRRYSDGLLTTASGEPVRNLETRDAVFELPYRSTEVLFRLGGYDVIEQLGKGGMGLVYRAYSLSLCRFCAMKVMIPNDNLSEVSILRFQNEAMLAARLRHPNIVPIFDSGEEDGRFFFVMDLIEGGTFKDIIEEGTPEAIRRGIRMIAKVARALEYAHSRSVVHRDIKPDNILIDANDEPYITDFGIAKGEDQELHLTQARSMLGTPYYMSPEQANGELQHIGPLSDVYALGGTLFHLLTGRVVFFGDTYSILLTKILYEEPEVPSVVAKRNQNVDIHADLDTICLKSLEKEAPRRYESAGAMAADLEAYLEDRPIAARPITSMERAQKLLRRNRAAFVGATAVLGILMLMTLAFGSIMIFNISRTSESLRALDRKAAVDQAATLDRAIGANMLEGRADIVRSLVAKLRKDPNLTSINVLRTNRTYAYTDLWTRKFVERRLTKPEVLAWIQEKYDGMMPKVQELKRIAFGNIDRSKPPENGKKYLFSPQEWDKLIARYVGELKAKKKPKPWMRIEEEGEERVLAVYWPISNGKKCQVCHGKVGDKVGNYDTSENRLRAVLVVRRSQRDVERRIRVNRLATMGIGVITTCAFLLLMLVFSRLFQVGLKPRSFGVGDS